MTADMPSCCEAIFFDFDGVLVESADIKTRAFRALYQPFGADVVGAAVAHHLANGGISRRKKIRHCHRTLLNIELGEDDLAALALRFSELVEEAVVAAPWVPGAQDMMIRNQGRRPMFVVSGTPDEELRRIVDRRQMGGFFTSVWGSPPEKPPIILELLARHRLAADRSIFIGDAMTDYLAAEATGLGFIGRVPEGEASPFPEGTAVIPDLSCFAEAGL